MLGRSTCGCWGFKAVRCVEVLTFALVMQGCSAAGPEGRPETTGSTVPGGLAGAPAPVAVDKVVVADAAPQSVILPEAAGVMVMAEPTEGGCGAQVTAPEPSRAVDIVWVVDASTSMLDEQQRIAENLARFADRITAADLDVRIIMLTTAATIPVVCVPPSADPAANTALNGDARYSFIEMGVDSRNPLDIAVQQFGRYQQFLRPDATTHLIFVSDDDSTFGGAISVAERSAAFQQEMQQLLGHAFYAHTISSPGPVACAPSQCMPPASQGFVCDIVAAICVASAPGLSYWQLAEDTGGLAASICETDWSMIFDPLTEAIVSASPLPCTYAIPPAPFGMELNLDKVNVSFSAPGGADAVWPRADALEACGDALAWYLDAAGTGGDEVHLCPSACTAAEQGGTLNLSFGCEAQILE